jgi:hypothetical protein
LENEKDIFDLLREESEKLTETPPTEVWQRLEKRLKTTPKRKRKRHPMELQLIGVIIAVLLLSVIGVVSWYITFQHQEILRGQQTFAGLRFLKGNWSLSDKKTLNTIEWEMKDSFILTGEKSVYFDKIRLSKMPIQIKNVGKDNVLIFNNTTHYLKEVKNDAYFFESKTKETVHLRKASNDRFTISFGEGIVFVYKKERY